jgi:hypothetical protein
VTDEEYRAKARDLHHDYGDCEIDDDAIVSRSEDSAPEPGAYVAAWVWVPNDDDE